MIVLLELRQSSQGIGGASNRAIIYLVETTSPTTSMQNFSSLGDQVSHHAEGEALGIIWKLEPKFEGSVVCHCLLRQEDAVESPDGW